MNKQKFGKLLSKSIKKVALKQHYRVSDVHEKLANALGYSVPSIEYWRQGNIPPTYNVLEKLIQELNRLNGFNNPQELAELWATTDYLQQKSVNRAISSFSVDNNQLIDDIGNAPYRIIKRDEHRQYFWDGRGVLERYFEMQSLSDYPLERITQKITLIDSPKIDEANFLLEVIGDENQNRVSISIDSVTEAGYKQATIFDPPLTRMEIIRYKLTRTIQGAQITSLERVTERFVNKLSSIPYNNWLLLVRVPTDELIARVTFPKNYTVSLPSSGGFLVRHAGIDDNQEKTFLIENEAFKFSNNNGVQTMSLHVKNAKAGRSYIFEWLPPPQREIDAALNNENNLE